MRENNLNQYCKDSTLRNMKIKRKLNPKQVGENNKNKSRNQWSWEQQKLKINKTKHLFLEKGSVKLAHLQPGESRKKEKTYQVQMSEIKEQYHDRLIRENYKKKNPNSQSSLKNKLSISASIKALSLHLKTLQKHKLQAQMVLLVNFH